MHPFTLTSAYDRMGVQLSGLKLYPQNALSIPSEPIMKGSIQVSGDGTPTILMGRSSNNGWLS